MSHKTIKRWTIDRIPHIAIVGAGVAGLRCADLLLATGIEVTIYEGKPHVGGRVHQISQEQHFIDMGANWIHGTEGNPIRDIANETGTQIASVREEIAIYSEYGCEMKEREKARAENLHGMMWGLISDAFKYSKENQAIPARVTLKDFFMSEIAKKDLEDKDQRILLQMAEQWGHFAGLPFAQQSLKYFWMEECLEGENLFVASSYSAILDRIARKATSQAQLYAGPSHFVTAVGTVTQSNPPRTFIHSCSAFAEFDACVVTIPLGALKRQSVVFSPELPPAIHQAVDQLGYGCLEKAYLTFPRAWWRRESDAAPAFMQFLHPQYDPHNTAHDIVDAMDLSLFSGGTAHATLLFYFHGEFARQTVKAYQAARSDDAWRRNDEGGRGAAFVCERFKPYYQLLPNYDSSEPDCVPTAATMTSWSSDDLAGFGSYSNFPASHEGAQLDRCVDTLRTGMPDRGIYLAGEHTAPYVALGTVTGAYWSGEQVAKRIIERFRVLE